MKPDRSSLLEVAHLSVRFGGLVAVDDVSLTIGAGTVVGLIGPNGGGKTTLIDALTGFVRAEGEVRFDGRRIDRMSPQRRARRGLARTFQSLELFEDLTVRENVLVAGEPPLFSGLLEPVRGVRPSVEAAARDALVRVGLDGMAERLPSTLSRAERKLVGVARALARRPQLLLLDEPAAGLDVESSARLGSQLRALADAGTVLLLVDHDMGLVLGACEHVIVLDLGRIIAAGTPAEIRADAGVIAAYLGEPDVSPPPSPVLASLSRDMRVPATPKTGERCEPVTQALELRGLSAGYDGVPVVRGLDLHVERSEVVALLGPNGAGKTTTLLATCGLLPRLAGEVRLDGRALRGRSHSEAARRGLALVPEDRGLFAGLTVEENLRLGAHGDRRRARDALDLFPELRSLERRPAGLLSGGQQQMLAIARAVAARPRVLAVDEMSLGLAPMVVERLLALVRDLADEHGLGILLVEQHVHLALAVADRAYVLTHGELVLEGVAADLLERPELLEASYLGEAPLDAVAAAMETEQ